MWERCIVVAPSPPYVLLSGPYPAAASGADEPASVRFAHPCGRDSHRGAAQRLPGTLIQPHQPTRVEVFRNGSGADFTVYGDSQCVQPQTADPPRLSGEPGEKGC